MRTKVSYEEMSVLVAVVVAAVTNINRKVSPTFSPAGVLRIKAPWAGEIAAAARMASANETGTGRGTNQRYAKVDRP